MAAEAAGAGRAAEAAGAGAGTGVASEGTGPVAAGRALCLPRGGTTCCICDMSSELWGREVAPMPCAMPGAGPVVIMSRGTMSTARTPPYADCRRETWSWYMRASRPTTAMPRRGDSPRSFMLMPACAWASMFSARTRASSLRLTPPSSISMAMPVCTSTAVTCTRVCGGE